MQEQSEITAQFIRRTDALSKKLRLSLRELAPAIGISKPTLFRSRAGDTGISPATWNKLESAERKVGITLDSRSEPTPSEGRVEEGRATYGQPQAFNEYLAMLRGMREEADHLAGGDKGRAAELFETMLKAWTDTVATKRRNTNHPFGSADRAAIEEARAVMARFDAAASPPEAAPSQEKRA